VAVKEDKTIFSAFLLSMNDCTTGPVEIASFARILDVTPDRLPPVEQAQAGGESN
jgi:hypothetical protein